MSSMFQFDASSSSKRKKKSDGAVAKAEIARDAPPVTAVDLMRACDGRESNMTKHVDMWTRTYLRDLEALDGGSKQAPAS